MMEFPFDGVVFDVDGVLFDTEKLSWKNWAEVGEHMGWPQVADHYLEVVGQNRADIRRRLTERMGPDFPTEYFLLTCSRRAQFLMEQNGVPLKSGVREILSALQKAGAVSYTHLDVYKRQLRGHCGRGEDHRRQAPG